MGGLTYWEEGHWTTREESLPSGTVGPRLLQLQCCHNSKLIVLPLHCLEPTPPADLRLWPVCSHLGQGGPISTSPPDSHHASRLASSLDSRLHPSSRCTLTHSSPCPTHTPGRLTPLTLAPRRSSTLGRVSSLSCSAWRIRSFSTMWAMVRGELFSSAESMAGENAIRDSVSLSHTCRGRTPRVM